MTLRKKAYHDMMDAVTFVLEELHDSYTDANKSGTAMLVFLETATAGLLAVTIAAMTPDAEAREKLLETFLKHLKTETLKSIKRLITPLKNSCN